MGLVAAVPGLAGSRSPRQGGGLVDGDERVSRIRGGSGAVASGGSWRGSSEALAEVERDGRVCPMPAQWQKLYELLPNKRRAEAGPGP